MSPPRKKPDTLRSARWFAADDLISVDIDQRSIHLEVSDEELARRRVQRKPPTTRYGRGYGWMFSQHVRQANEGCDFDYLETDFGSPVDEPSIN